MIEACEQSKNKERQGWDGGYYMERKKYNLSNGRG
jgi:hypothetical protein